MIKSIRSGVVTSTSGFKASISGVISNARSLLPGVDASALKRGVAGACGELSRVGVSAPPCEGVWMGRKGVMVAGKDKGRGGALPLTLGKGRSVWERG